ncbi:hypothetical protein BKP56_07225 [Marinilactibacillus sp. 15R]|uniref:hypothetical protein n=1 Tax=Marinilactibacillus sp. 15R TaxID=1911586 RepID=UPI00090BA34C|nr:hypothetical protein [Marinilactibacillus sp. 15R]API89057.1 hypothetical protein BKP56_07225 [Marinilactibacillus sp. 15R]
MLANIQENVNLQAESKIGEEVAVTFACLVSVEGNGNAVRPTIRNVDLYEANKTQIRNDQREFQNLVWETEDRLAANQAEGTSE